jgi:hypothetical protein
MTSTPPFRGRSKSSFLESPTRVIFTIHIVQAPSLTTLIHHASQQEQHEEGVWTSKEGRERGESWVPVGRLVFTE